MFCNLVVQVDAVRAEYNRNIDKMAEEIQKLEEVSCTANVQLVQKLRSCQVDSMV